VIIKPECHAELVEPKEGMAKHLYRFTRTSFRALRGISRAVVVVATSCRLRLPLHARFLLRRN